MADGAGTRYRGPMSHEQCAKNSFEAEYPELWEGLASTFAPNLLLTHNSTSTWTLRSGRRWSILPTDHETFDAMTAPSADTQNEGFGFGFYSGSSGSGYLRGDKLTGNGNGPRSAPLTVHGHVHIGQLSSDAMIWASCKAKGGTKFNPARDYGYKVYSSSVSQTLRFEAHDGTAVGNGTGRFLIAPGSLYSAGDTFNFTWGVPGEPLESTESKFWYNGEDKTATTGDSGSGNAAFAATHDTTCYGGTGTAASDDVLIYNFTTWRRMLADWEHEILTTDPLALYRKRPQAKSYFYPPWHIHATDISAGIDIVSLGGIYQTEKVVLSG